MAAAAAGFYVCDAIVLTFWALGRRCPPVNPHIDEMPHAMSYRQRQDNVHVESHGNQVNRIMQQSVDGTRKKHNDRSGD